LARDPSPQAYRLHPTRRWKFSYHFEEINPMNLPDPDEYFAAVSRQFGQVFGEIDPPRPLVPMHELLIAQADEELAQQEAVEGMFSEGEQE